MTEKFELPVAEHVSAGVFDVQGRLVSSLAQDELLGAGNHELRWDGLDRTRAKVAAGVYLFEMRAGDETLVRRALVIR
jgi:flagellar hook assembly protein FlgD